MRLVRYSCLLSNERIRESRTPYTTRSISSFPRSKPHFRVVLLALVRKSQFSSRRALVAKLSFHPAVASLGERRVQAR